MSANKYLSMSDEDFLKLPEAQTGIITEDGAETAVVVEPVVEEPIVAEPAAEVTDPAVVAEPEPVVEEGTEPNPDTQVTPAVTPVISDGNTDPNAQPAVVEPTKDEIDYKAAYSQIVGPLKANKGTIEVKSLDEAKRLMQMGAGYADKMRELNPHLKTIRLLEKNGLLGDENQLSYLIDLQQRNPDAIKKLIKDSGIDPLDIDLESPVNYTPTNRSVSDNEIRFKSELDNLKLVEGGQETIDVINKTWDQASVKELYENDGALEAIRDQRVNGVYDQITAEMQRQIALGNIPAGTPFIRAYTAVGDHMTKNNLFKEPTPANPAPVVQDPPQAQVLATRVATPKPVAVNADLVAAATTTKPTAARKGAFVNPAGMSDEEFLKKYGDKY